MLPDFIAAVIDLNIQVWGTDPLQCPCCKSTLESVRTILRLHSLREGIITFPRPPSQPLNIKPWSPSCHPWQEIKEWTPDDEPDLTWFKRPRNPPAPDHESIDQRPVWKSPSTKAGL